MKTLLRCIVTPLAVLAFVGCGNPPGESQDPDPIHLPADQQSIRVLRPNIGVDLAQVQALAVVNGTSVGRSVTWNLGSDQDDSQPHLVAFTLTGEVLNISLVEEGNPDAVGTTITQPFMQAIYPTASWILFHSPGFSVINLHEDGTQEPIACSTIAARRVDGALFCAPLAIRDAGNASGNVDPLNQTVRANAAGNIIYILGNLLDVNGESASETPLLYKVIMDESVGPTGTVALNPWLNPVWFVVNAAGDLLVSYPPSPLEPTATTTEVLPVDGGTSFAIDGTHNAYATCGDPGAVDENTFYLTSGGGGGWEFESILRVVTKDGSSFAQSPETVDLGFDTNCSFLFHLSDGIYMACGGQPTSGLVRVIANGAVIPTPTRILFSEVDSIISANGAMMIPVTNQVVFLARFGETLKFVRHTGLVQQDIPLDADIVLTKFIVANNGSITFFGYRSDTMEKIQGQIAEGSSEVVVTTTEVFDSNQVIVFTQIN